jgi:mRNA interferase MazF
VVAPRIKLRKGDIVLVPFPFSNDPSKSKLRPAVVLWANTKIEEVMLCFITTRHLDKLDPEDVILDTSDVEFNGTGLKIPSKIKTTKIVTLNYKLVQNRLGELGKQQTQKLNSTLLKVLKLK